MTSTATANSAPANHDEQQFLDAVQLIIERGHLKGDRTGVGTLSTFGMRMRYDLRKNTFPLLTTNHINWLGVVEELLWSVKGCTNAKVLAEKNVNIWNVNRSQSILDEALLSHREEGDLGPTYGFQWRHFGAKYQDMHTDYTGQGVDQLSNVIQLIKSNPNDRRILMTSWNPVDLPAMALPPCDILAQFYVANGELSCKLYQESADMSLSAPFKVASYALLTYMIAHITGLKPGDLAHAIGEGYVYTNHIEPLRMQLARKPRPFPNLLIKRQIERIEDFTAEDFDLVGYAPHPKIQIDMTV